MYIVEDYEKKGELKDLVERIYDTAIDNMKQGAPSLLILDDCLNEMMKGTVPIVKLMSNVRALGLTVISLWQSNIISGRDGKVVRTNQSTIVFFRSMIEVVHADWMKNDKLSSSVPEHTSTSKPLVCLSWITSGCMSLRHQKIYR